MANALNDSDFYSRREVQERNAAERSDGEARRVHLDLAERYAAARRDDDKSL